MRDVWRTLCCPEPADHSCNAVPQGTNFTEKFLLSLPNGEKPGAASAPLSISLNVKYPRTPGRFGESLGLHVRQNPDAHLHGRDVPDLAPPPNTLPPQPARAAAVPPPKDIELLAPPGSARQLLLLLELRGKIRALLEEKLGADRERWAPDAAREVLQEGGILERWSASGLEADQLATAVERIRQAGREGFVQISLPQEHVSGAGTRHPVSAGSGVTAGGSPLKQQHQRASTGSGDRNEELQPSAGAEAEAGQGADSGAVRAALAPAAVERRVERHGGAGGSESQPSRGAARRRSWGDEFFAALSAPFIGTPNRPSAAVEVDHMQIAEPRRIGDAEAEGDKEHGVERIKRSDSVDDGILPDEPPPSSSLQGSLVAPPRQDDGGLDAAAQAGADERKDSSGPSEEKDAEILAAAAAAAGAAAAAAADDDDAQQRQDGGIGDSSPEPAVTPEPASEMDAAGGSKTSASKKPTKRGADIVSARNAEDVDADEIMNPKRDTSEKEAGPAAVGKDKETPKASAKGAKSERSTPPEKRVSPGRSFMNALAGSLWRQSKPKTRGVRHIHSPGLSRQAQHFFVDLGASRSLSLATC